MLMEVLVIYNVDPPVHCVKCQNVQDASRCPHLIQCNDEVGKLLKHTDNSTPPPLIYPTETNHYLVLPIKKHNRKCSRQYPYAIL